MPLRVQLVYYYSLLFPRVESFFKVPVCALFGFLAKPKECHHAIVEVNWQRSAN